MKKLMVMAVVLSVMLVVTTSFAQEGPGGGQGGRRMNPARSFLRLFDADEDGQITKAEYMKVFTDIDKDKDGILTSEELEAYQPEAAGAGEGRRNMFESNDADKNGTLSKEEFPGSDERFDSIDADGNGEITPEEMQNARGQRRGRE